MTGNPRDRPVTVEPYCWRCGRRLAAYVTEPWEMRCRACKARNRGGTVPGVLVTAHGSKPPPDLP